MREPAEIRVRRFDPAPGVPPESAFETACNELAAQGFTLRTWNFVRLPGEPYDVTIVAVFEKPTRDVEHFSRPITIRPKMEMPNGE